MSAPDSPVLRRAMDHVARAAIATSAPINVPQVRVLAGAALNSLPRRPAVERPTVPVLTDRERQVLNGMANGRTNAEISQELFLATDTVKTHARRIYRRLAARDRAHAVALGFRYGLIDPARVTPGRRTGGDR